MSCKKSECEKKSAKASKKIEKLLESSFPKVFKGELTLKELEEQVDGFLTKDEIRLRYVESQFPIVIENGEEPTEEEYQKYFVVTEHGKYLTFPSRVKDHRLVPKTLEDEEGNEFPIIIPADQNPTKKQRKKYFIVDGNDGELLLYSKLPMYDNKGKKYPKKLKKGEEPDRDHFFVGEENIRYSMYPKVELWENQKEPMERLIEILANNDVSLNCSEQGLGKTLMTIYVLQELGLDFHVVVICPSGPAEEMWRRNLLAYGLDPFFIGSYRLIGGTWGKEYHSKKILERKERVTEGGIKKIDFTVSEELGNIIKSKERPLLLICDEVHHAKNKGSNTTHAIRAIIKAIVENDQNYSRAIYLSGTPMDNIAKQAVNYLHLMGILNTTHLYLSRGGFIELTGAQQILAYCEKLDKEHGNNYTEEALLKAFTNERTGVFDTKWKIKASKIAKIPEIMITNVIRKYLFVAALKVEDDEEIKEDLGNFYLDVDSEESKNFLIENGKKIELLARYNDETKEAEKPQGKDMSELTKLIKARQVIKATLLGEYLKERLNEYPNIKIIVALDYNDPQEILEEILEDFNPIIYDGKTKSKMKKEGCSNVIEKFNTDPDYRVWIGKTRSMSECINLQDTTGKYPREMYILPSLSALNTDQVAKRHNRGNNKSIPVTRLVFVAGQETEMYIFSSLARKYTDMRNILPDEAKDTRSDISDLRNIYQKELKIQEEEKRKKTRKEEKEEVDSDDE